MANPFTQLTCSIRYDNARVLMWQMAPDYNYPADFTLKVENCRIGGPWETLATGLENSCVFIDTRRRNWNKVMNESYRLRLTSESTGEDYVSEPCDAGEVATKPFSAEVKNIFRQVELQLKQSGSSGVLLKRKLWGPHCPKCIDFEGQASVNEHCPLCFGTGIIGGYYNGITLPVIIDAVQCKEGVILTGQGEASIIQARCLAYPWMANGDIWCEDDTNARYSITDVEHAAMYKTTPIIYKLTMHRIEYTDALYTPPIDDKVNMKDLWNSAQVNYTPQKLQELEQQSQDDWGVLDEL